MKGGELSEATLSLMSWNGDPGHYVNFSVKLRDLTGAVPATDATIYEIFRCGFSHEYFSKGLLLVHSNDDPAFCIPADQGVGWIDHEGVDTLRFHTNAYYRDLRSAYASLHAHIKAQPDARKNFGDAIMELVKRKVERK